MADEQNQTPVEGAAAEAGTENRRGRGGRGLELRISAHGMRAAGAVASDDFTTRTRARPGGEEGKRRTNGVRIPAARFAGALPILVLVHGARATFTRRRALGGAVPTGSALLALGTSDLERTHSAHLARGVKVRAALDGARLALGALARAAPTARSSSIAAKDLVRVTAQRARLAGRLTLLLLIEAHGARSLVGAVASEPRRADLADTVAGGGRS